MRLTQLVSMLAVMVSLCPVLTGRASAQTFTITPTYLVSAGRYDENLPGSRYRAWGLMLGQERAGQWWQPHLWFQRYDLDSYTRDVNPGVGDPERSGWSVSVGPSLEFIDSDPWMGAFVPQVGLRSRGVGSVWGGAGFHFGFRAGGFRPQLFGRIQHMAPHTFWTVGVGVSLEIRRGEGRDRPVF
jgi:hypothetical protein